MQTNHSSLRNTLLQYKRYDLHERQELLKVTLDKAHSQANPSSVEEAIEISHQLTLAATLINYADALRKIENQDYFDILIDFKMPDVFVNEKFNALNEYFEFHPAAPQMRLKRSITAIPKAIWHLFREAQLFHLEKINKSELFNLHELDIDNPPTDQLYPLSIQMFGKLENEAVDRISSNQEGKYRFAHRFGFYLLPGGGMVEINLEKSESKLLEKMLDEHLEEEHANLWEKAADLFNTLDKMNFLGEIRKILEKTAIAVELRERLQESTQESGSPAEILARLIKQIDAYTQKQFPDTDAKTLQPYQGLRAMLQVETFKHTPLYQEALGYLKENTSCVDIEQFGDTRACGGRQISHSFIMTGEPLDTWFQNKFAGAPAELGDDLSGGTIKHLSFLEAVSQFRLIKFSHLLIVETHQAESLTKGHLKLPEIWDEGQFALAKRAIQTEGTSVLESLPNATQEKRHPEPATSTTKFFKSEPSPRSDDGGGAGPGLDR